MVEYKFDTQDTYIKEIIKNLNEFDKPFVSNTKKEAYAFYATEGECLVGAINVYYNNGWIMILNLFYDNTDILADLVGEICHRYKDEAIGIHLRTYNNDRLLEFISLGFDHCATIKSKTEHDDLYYADLTDFGREHRTSYNIASQSKKDDIYQLILEKNAKLDLEKVTAPQLIDDVTIVALENGVFVGGLVAKANEDSFHVDLLVVVPEYRRRNIGKKLMTLAEVEARARNIFTMDLSTGEHNAMPFYHKLGYEVVYTRQNYPVGLENYKLIKHLDIDKRD